MKKLVALLLAFALLFCSAFAETAETIEAAESAETAAPVPVPAGGPTRLAFEDGFVLDIPAGWQYYPVDEDMAARGVLYCLGDAFGERFLYIQSWESDCADIDSLKTRIEAEANPQTCGVYSFNGTDFVIYDLVEGDVSCCAALMDSGVLNFVFTPQSDAEFMVTATQIIASFGILADLG